MKNPQRKMRAAGIVVIAFGVMVVLLNSFGFNPDPSDASTFMARAQQKSARGITVEASALGASESRRFFGENLARSNIQPVWLSIENQTDDELAFVPIAMDPDYYSPYEAAYRFRGIISFAANRERDQFFLSNQIANALPPHSKTTGFMYGVLDAGIKYARIIIAGPKRLETFDFALPVPGAKFVGADISADTIYPGKDIKDLDLASLRTTFADWICCTSNADGTRSGDPLNLVIVESRESSIIPFISRSWHLARQVDLASAIETARAFIFRDEFLTSPVSPLYVLNRKEDFVLQKARSTINERVHARFWLTPYTFEGRKVWVGQVSRDIGVRLTSQTWNLTTHKIAPDVDFDRAYVLQDILLSGFVERYGYVDGVGAAPASAPRQNLTGDPYYTDGLRAVIFLTNQLTPLQNVERLPWNVPLAPREEVGHDTN